MLQVFSLGDKVWQGLMPSISKGCERDKRSIRLSLVLKPKTEGHLEILG